MITLKVNNKLIKRGLLNPLFLSLIFHFSLFTVIYYHIECPKLRTNKNIKGEIV